MLALEIPAELFEQMLDRARSEAPIEACGILAGRDDRAEKFYPMTNAEGRPDHYMMDPQEQFAAVKDIRASGLTMLAIFHSHPATPARPSAEDIRLGLTLGVAYVIVSLADANAPVTKGFAFDDEKTREIDLRIGQA